MGYLLQCGVVKSINITFQQMYDFKLFMAEKCIQYIMNFHYNSVNYNKSIIIHRDLISNNNNTLNDYMNYLSSNFDILNEIGLLCIYNLLFGNTNNIFTIDMCKNIYNSIQLFIKINNNNNNLSSIQPIIEIFKLAKRYKEEITIL